VSLTLARRGRGSADHAAFARRLVVAAAAVGGLAGILAERPVLTVALRVGAIAAGGLLVITLAERAVLAHVARARPKQRGGDR
jgi:hypothetical protein